MSSAILIVENDETLLGFYTELLGALGRIDQASSANTAIKLLESNDYHVIISDYKMDDGDGIELAKHLFEKKLQIPIILLTGYATKELAIQSVQYGVYSFLEKRCSPDEILSAANRAIEFCKMKRRESNFSMMGEITSILMHEIVDPLNRSLSRLELIENRLDEKEQGLKNKLADVREDLNYLARLVFGVRSQVRGHKEVYLKKYSIKQFIEVLESLQVGLPIRNLIEKADDVFIRSDVVLFNQVISNLRKNSEEAMEPFQIAEMKLDCLLEGDEIIFEFVNNSPMIPIELRKRIFEPFISSKKDKNENFGIGLYFCGQTLKSHGGRINVKDSMPTAFVMRIPRCY